MLGLKKEVQMNKFLFSLFCIFMLSSCSDLSPGFFGYNNVYDCNLDKMEGQPGYMAPTVLKACFEENVGGGFYSKEKWIIMRVSESILGFVGSLHYGATANIHECVLDRMEGQPENMISIARKSCQIEKE